MVRQSAFYFPVALLVVLLISCAGTMQPALFETKRFPGCEMGDVVAAVTTVLPEYGYTVSTVNEKIGVVSTDWKEEAPGGFIFATTSVRRKISVTVDRETMKIKMQVIKQKKEKPLFGKEPIWMDEKLSRKDEEVIREMLSKMGKLLEV